MTEPSIETARDLCARHTNWGRWGPEDQRGTLRQVRPERVVDAAQAVRQGTAGHLHRNALRSRWTAEEEFNRFDPIYLVPAMKWARSQTPLFAISRAETIGTSAAPTIRGPGCCNTGLTRAPARISGFRTRSTAATAATN